MSKKQTRNEFCISKENEIWEIVRKSGLMPGEAVFLLCGLAVRAAECTYQNPKELIKKCIKINMEVKA